MLIICSIIATVIGMCLLYFFDPETTTQYPRCPFYALTGLQCPGCGTLRGLHALMHLRLLEAWRYNPLMIASIPFIILLSLFPRFCKSVKVGWMVLAATLLWWIARNL